MSAEGSGFQRSRNMVNSAGGPLPLTSLNHISIVCKSVEDSMNFYENVLGFVPIKRPGSFDFDGAWLFNYGVGIHLLQSGNPEDLSMKTEINPKDSHISFQVIDYSEALPKGGGPPCIPVHNIWSVDVLFCPVNVQCESMQAVERRLQEMSTRYVKNRVEEGGVHVDQLFIHDPDGFMIEICNCENLPVVPLGSPACSLVLSSRLLNSPMQQQKRNMADIQQQQMPSVTHQRLKMGTNPANEECAMCI